MKKKKKVILNSFVAVEEVELAWLVEEEVDGN